MRAFFTQWTIAALWDIQECLHQWNTLHLICYRVCHEMITLSVVDTERIVILIRCRNAWLFFYFRKKVIKSWIQFMQIKSIFLRIKCYIKVNLISTSVVFFPSSQETWTWKHLILFLRSFWILSIPLNNLCPMENALRISDGGIEKI